MSDLAVSKGSSATITRPRYSNSMISKTLTIKTAPAAPPVTALISEPKADTVVKSEAQTYDSQVSKILDENKETKTDKDKDMQKKLRRHWGVKVAIASSLSILGGFSAKSFSEGVQAALKEEKIKMPEFKTKGPLAIIGTGLLAGANLGTAWHMLSTKKSRLHKDKATDSFGKRLGIAAAVGAVATTASHAITKDMKALPKTSMRLTAAYLAVAGLRAIFDKSLQREKEMQEMAKKIAIDAMAENSVKA